MYLSIGNISTNYFSNNKIRLEPLNFFFVNFPKNFSILRSHPSWPPNPTPSSPSPTPNFFFFEFSQKLQFFVHIHPDPPNPTQPIFFFLIFTKTSILCSHPPCDPPLPPTRPDPPPPKKKKKKKKKFSQKLHFSVHIYPDILRQRVCRCDISALPTPVLNFATFMYKHLLGA